MIRNRTLRSLTLLFFLTSGMGVQAMNTVKKTLQIIGAAGTCVLTAHTALILYDKYFQEPLRHAQENKNHKAPEHVQKLSQTYAKIMCGNNITKWIRFYYAQKVGLLDVYDGPPCDQPNYFKNHPFHDAFTSIKGGIFFPSQSFHEQSAPQAKQRHDICHENGHIIQGDVTKINNPYKEGNRSWFKQEHITEKACIKTLHALEDYEAIEQYPSCPTLGHIPYYCGMRSGLKELSQKFPHDQNLQKLCTKYCISSNTPTTWQQNYANYLILKKNN